MPGTQARYLTQFARQSYDDIDHATRHLLPGALRQSHRERNGNRCARPGQRLADAAAVGKALMLGMDETRWEVLYRLAEGQRAESLSKELGWTPA